MVVAERVPDPEQAVELVEALPGQGEELFGVLVEVGRELARAVRPSGMPSCSSRSTW